MSGFSVVSGAGGGAACMDDWQGTNRATGDAGGPPPGLVDQQDDLRRDPGTRELDEGRPRGIAE